MGTRCQNVKNEFKGLGRRNKDTLKLTEKVINDFQKYYSLVFQSDMFDNMSIIVFTQIHKIFVHFFGIGSVSSYFL